MELRGSRKRALIHFMNEYNHRLTVYNGRIPPNDWWYMKGVIDTLVFCGSILYQDRDLMYEHMSSRENDTFELNEFKDN